MLKINIFWPYFSVEYKLTWGVFSSLYLCAVCWADLPSCFGVSGGVVALRLLYFCGNIRSHTNFVFFPKPVTTRQMLEPVLYPLCRECCKNVCERFRMIFWSTPSRNGEVSYWLIDQHSTWRIYNSLEIRHCFMLFWLMIPYAIWKPEL